MTRNNRTEKARNIDLYIDQPNRGEAPPVARLHGGSARKAYTYRPSKHAKGKRKNVPKTT